MIRLNGFKRLVWLNLAAPHCTRHADLATMMRMGGLNRMIYLGMNVIFLVGWLLTLIGLSLVQKWCKDNEDLADSFMSEFTSIELGKDCRKFYRCAFESCSRLRAAPLLAGWLHTHGGDAVKG
jgi:hypothetical protein